MISSVNTSKVDAKSKNETNNLQMTSAAKSKEIGTKSHSNIYEVSVNKVDKYTPSEPKMSIGIYKPSSSDTGSVEFTPYGEAQTSSTSSSEEIAQSDATQEVGNGKPKGAKPPKPTSADQADSSSSLDHQVEDIENEIAELEQKLNGMISEDQKNEIESEITVLETQLASYEAQAV